MLLPRPLPLLCVASTAATLLLQSSHAFLTPPPYTHTSSRRIQSSHKRPLGASSASHSSNTVPLPAPPAEWTGGLPPDKHALFLRDFWQQKPLLIRQAFDPAVAVVGPSELLALACDDMVTSRLIEHRPRTEAEEEEEEEDDEDKESEWTVRQGPFDEEDFEEDAEGEERRWTVLVQEVDRHVPEVADLLQSFRFLPNWRVDDIMISYAPQAGGIGPHVDNYDVFLLQGHGTRKWSIQNSLLSPADELASLLPNSPVRILGSTWEETHSWVLQPGDMLYLPPRVPHNGVSLDKDCMTYSIGFRAPTQMELLQAATTTAVAAAAATTAVPGQIFYSDPSLALPRDAGEITPKALSQLKEMVKAGLASVLEDEYVYAKWMGKHLTKPKRSRRRVGEKEEVEDEEEDENEEEGAGGYSVEMDREEAEAILQELMEEGGREDREEEEEQGGVYRAEGLKFAHALEGRLLFVDGHVWELKDEDEERRRWVCACLTGGPSPLPAGELKELLKSSSECGEIVREWLERGVLYVLGEEIEVVEEEEEEEEE